MIISKDKGQSWSEPVRVSDAPDDGNVFTVSVATAAGGRVAVSYYSLQNDPDRKFLADEYVRISEDGGASFSPSIRVTPHSFDLRQGAPFASNIPFLGDYQGLAGGSDGRFHLLWITTGVASSVTGKGQPEAFTFATP